MTNKPSKSDIAQLTESEYELKLKMLHQKATKKYYQNNKEIIKKKNKAYYDANKPKRKIRDQKYRIQNKDKISIDNSEYYKNNKLDIKDSKRSWYIKNKDKINSLHRDYYDKNKETINGYVRTYKRRFYHWGKSAERRNIPFTLTIEYIESLPLICHYTGVPLTLEHKKENTISLERIDSDKECCIMLCVY